MKQLHGTDQRTMAYINLYGVLGALEELCELDSEAKSLIAGERIRVGFHVSGGPSATLCFADGSCKLVEGVERCEIRLPFSSPEKFNGLIDGTVTPIPTKGLTKIKFLLKTFTKLTGILTRYLRASEEDLQDPAFFDKSTTLLFYVISVALSEIGSHDRIGRPAPAIFPTAPSPCGSRTAPQPPSAAAITCCTRLRMRWTGPWPTWSFPAWRLRGICSTAGATAWPAWAPGDVRVGGMVVMVDNMNRILDRVALYLA